MSVNDRLMKAFEEYGGLTLNERIYHFLGSLGFTNSLSDRLAKYTSGRYRGYRALIEDFGRSSQPWEDLFAEGQTLHFDFIKQRYGVRVPESLTLVAGDSINGVGYVSEELAAAAGDPELATGSISDQPVSGFNLLGLEFTDAGSMTQLGVYFQGDVEESLASIRVWVGGVEVEGPPSALLYDVNLDVTVVAYANPIMEPWVDGGQYNIGITLDGQELPENYYYTTNVNDLGILTRASTATYWGPSGTLLEAAVDEARIQHDPVTGEPLGLLLEPSATNLVPQSTDLSLWTQHNVETTLDGPPLVNGLASSKVSLIEPGLGSGIRVTGLTNTEADYCTGVFLKAGSATHAIVSATGSGNFVRHAAEIDLVTGEVNHTYADPTRIISSSVQVTPVGSGWFHVRLVSTMVALLRSISISPSNGQGSGPLVASGLSGGIYGLPDGSFTVGLETGDYVYVAGVQLEEGSVTSSYIPTTDSPVTRAADNAVIDLSDVFNPDEGTLRITAQVPEGEVVASLGDIQVVSDSDEKKSYRMTYSDCSGVPTVSLGNGIHSKLEYFPEAQS